jgi:HlyD family secretion protein
VRVASKVSGRVEAVPFLEGARVTAGDVLVRLSTTETTLALERARAERAQADAMLRLLQAGARPEDVRQAEAHLAAAQGDARAAEAELAAARADEARFEQLLRNRAGSVKQRDDTAARRSLAEARLAAATDRAGAAAASLQRVRSGARLEEVEAARARVRAVDTELATLQQRQADAIVSAPITGIVTSRLVEPGELAAVGVPLVVLTDLDRAWVNAYVEEPLVPALRLDAPATILTDAGDRLDGRITFVSPRAEFTPRNVQTSAERARLVFRVKVSTDNRDGILKPGMPVEVLLGDAGAR